MFAPWAKLIILSTSEKELSNPPSGFGSVGLIASLLEELPPDELSRVFLIKAGIILKGISLKSISAPGIKAEYLAIKFDNSRILPGH